MTLLEIFYDKIQLDKPATAIEISDFVIEVKCSSKVKITNSDQSHNSYK